MPTEAEQILDAIVATARGDRATDGRDTVSRPRVDLCAMHGRALPATIVERRAETYVLRIGDGELALSLIPQGSCLFDYGEVRIAVPDRRAGAAFVEQLARLLASPLGLGGWPAEPPQLVIGGYVKLGASNDADGACWNVYKLFLGDGPEPGELFLRISAGIGRAAFVEKWSKFRAPILAHLDRTLGYGRTVAERRLVDVTDGVRFTVPLEWVVRRHDDHVEIVDPVQDVLLEVSHQPYPLHPRLPGLVDRLGFALEADGRGDLRDRVVHVDRGDVEHAWVEHDYEIQDGKRWLGRARISMMANDALHALATYYYWPEDEGWAIPEWERIMSTMWLSNRTK